MSNPSKGIYTKIKKADWLAMWEANQRRPVNRRLCNEDLAKEMKQSSRSFYDQKKRYADDILQMAERNKAELKYKTIAHCIDAMDRKLVDSNIIDLVRTLINEEPKSGGKWSGDLQDGEGTAGTVLINLQNMNGKELQKIVDERIQAARDENSK